MGKVCKNSTWRVKNVVVSIMLAVVLFCANVTVTATNWVAVDGDDNIVFSVDMDSVREINPQLRVCWESMVSKNGWGSYDLVVYHKSGTYATCRMMGWTEEKGSFDTGMMDFNQLYWRKVSGISLKIYHLVWGT